ncbi:DUF222 domain-containing protein [Geodermatophilus sp. URMC 60]
MAPAVGWASGPLGAVQAAAREMSRQAAVRVRAVAAFAATRPASTDRAQGERGAMSAERWAARAEVLRPVSEWAAQELSIALNVTTQAAEAELERSVTLVTRLPRVLEGLEAGLLHERHLWCLLEHVAPIADDARRARVEHEVLEWMAARNQVTTSAALGDRVRRVVARLGARDAAQDLARALTRRGISLRADRTPGMSVLTVVCTTPEAQALHRALGAYADALEAEPGDGRTRGQQLVDCLMDLVLRPGQAELPPVQALLTIVASVHTVLGGDQLGEVDGKPVPAEMARQLARAFAGLHPTPLAADGTARAAEDTGARSTATADSAACSATEGIGVESAARDSTTQAARADVASAAGGVPWPVDVEGGPIERAAAELSDPDFDRWLDDLVRRGFGDDPAPGDPGWEPGGPPEPAGWDVGPWVDPCEWLDDLADLEESGEDHPAPPRSDSAAPSGDAGATSRGGWWAAADRAVADVGDAVHAARIALGAAQRMVRTAQRADAADEAAWQAGAAGRVSTAEDTLGALATAADTQREELAALLGATAGGGLADRPRIAVTDATTGALLALTDLTELRRAGTCGRPACRRRPETCGHDLTGRPGAGSRGHPRLPARRAAGPLRPRPGPALPLPRLPPPHPRRRRTRPRPRLARRRHRRGQPRRLLHRPPPRQAPGTGLDLRHGPRRHPHRHHPHRPDRRHRTTPVLTGRHHPAASSAVPTDTARP